MTNRFLFYCLVVVLLTACRGREYDSLAFEPPVFPEARQVVVTYLPGNYIFDDVLMQMFGVDDFILLNAYSEGRYLHLFDKETGTHLRSFAHYGRGPGEFLAPPKCHIDENDNTLYTYEGFNGQSRYRSYRVKEMLQGNLPLPYKEESIQFSKREGERFPGGARLLFAWQDKRFFSRNRNYRFEVQDTMGNTLCLYDHFPKQAMPPDIDSSGLRRCYSIYSDAALKPDMGKFVFTSSLGCIMEIFTINESGQIVREAEKHFLPAIYQDNKSSIGFIDKKTIFGIGGFYVTDDYIYAQYDGGVYNERERRVYDKHLAVFDWDGNPVCLYVLDWGIRTFFIDEEQNRCYLVGIDANDEILMGYFDL